MVKNLPASAGDSGSIPGKIPWSRKWQPTPVFLPGKLHVQRSLVGHSPWGHKESDRTEHTHRLISTVLYSRQYYPYFAGENKAKFAKHYMTSKWV